MSRLRILIVCVVSMTVSLGTAAEPEQAKDEPSVWMKKKLDRSKDILEGLASGDFDKIAKSTENLKLLAKFESFARGGTPGYRTQLQIFEEANEEIIRQADRDNLEGAALAFNQLTNSCVNCHKQLRKAKER